MSRQQSDDTAGDTTFSSRNVFLVPCFVIVDYIIFTAIVVFWFICMYTDYLPNASRRGFVCDDVTLSMPYRDTQLLADDYIYLIYVLFPALLILFGECTFTFCRGCRQEQKEVETGRRKVVVSCGLRIHPCIRRILRFCGLYFVGVFSTWILADITQRITGKLKPYFLVVCDPTYDRRDCPRYVTTYDCANNDSRIVEDARRSFPSMQASIGAFSSIFTVIYLSSQLSPPRARLSVMVLSLAYAGGAFIWGVSKISAYHHHLEDVWGGFILGASIAFYVVFSILKTFEESCRGATPVNQTSLRPQDSLERTNVAVFQAPQFRLPRAQPVTSRSQLSTQNDNIRNSAVSISSRQGQGTRSSPHLHTGD